MVRNYNTEGFIKIATIWKSIQWQLTCVLIFNTLSYTKFVNFCNFPQKNTNLDNFFPKKCNFEKFSTSGETFSQFFCRPGKNLNFWQNIHLWGKMPSSTYPKETPLTSFQRKEWPKRRQFFIRCLYINILFHLIVTIKSF